MDKRLVLLMVMIGLVLTPSLAMVKQKTYIGQNPILTNSTVFYQDQPVYFSYFEYVSDDGLATDINLHSDYPISCTYIPYYIQGGENGTLEYNVSLYYQNGTHLDNWRNGTIEYVSGSTYLDNNESTGFSGIIPLSSQIYISLTRVEGNFTMLQQSCWIKQQVTYNQANLDSLSTTLVGILESYEAFLSSFVVPILNTFAFLWEYLLQYILMAEIVIWTIRRAIQLGTAFTNQGGR